MGSGKASEFWLVWIWNKETAFMFLEPGQYDKVYKLESCEEQGPASLARF